MITHSPPFFTFWYESEALVITGLVYNVHFPIFPSFDVCTNGLRYFIEINHSKRWCHCQENKPKWNSPKYFRYFFLIFYCLILTSHFIYYRNEIRNVLISLISIVKDYSFKLWAENSNWLIWSWHRNASRFTTVRPECIFTIVNNFVCFHYLSISEL